MTALTPTADAWTRRPGAAPLAGVCAALSRALRVPVRVVRAAVLLPALPLLPALLLLGDLGSTWSAVRALLVLAAPSVLGYAALWWALPDGSGDHDELPLPDGTAAVRGRPREAAEAEPAPRRRGLRGGRWLLAAAILGAVAVLLVVTVGADLVRLLSGTGTVQPASANGIAGAAVLVGMACAGVALGLMPLGDLDRDRWAGRTSSMPLGAGLALLGGLALLLLALLVAVASTAGQTLALQLALVALGVLALLALLLVPWGRRLWAGLREETEQRAVMQHHRETTAHLHDSVLQTLVVLQRPGTAAEEMRRIARVQERELRRWLYRDGASEVDAATEMRAAVEELTARIEDSHGVEVSTVIVGDAPLEERHRPLLGALQEATLNACRHGREGVDVFVDVSPAQVQAFVRDRGPGFELAEVPADRLGVRESIIGRMERAGGRAEVRRAPGGGTEVALILPGAGS
ncbi:hypothetical protein V1260_13330 [Brachybacterium sp. J144]|uniref:sensor histidine kinase n=1 Tax=Brachybacterium sp. J144 TaxID=3116487 RepID=UPI002E77465E|nr:hypothetical protein [Brachybacterium sp. J144]MEE1651764.1 hypothetical protein [Brachybacterium sp. J144]